MGLIEREEAIREVLIAATDIIPPGDEPFAGWSAVLAERINAVLPPDRGAVDAETLEAAPLGTRRGRALHHGQRRQP